MLKLNISEIFAQPTVVCGVGVNDFYSTFLSVSLANPIARLTYNGVERQNSIRGSETVDSLGDSVTLS